MSDREELDRLLKEAYELPEMREARAAGALPDDLLARYHAGQLAPEEEAVVAREIAANPENLRRLALLDDAIDDTARRLDKSGLAALRDSVARWAASLAVPAVALRYAGALATLTIVMVVGYQMVSPRPPIDPGLPFPSELLGRVRGDDGPPFVDLPWGDKIGRIDADWTLHAPVGDNPDLGWFVWRPLVHARDYRVTLYDGDGSILLRTAATSKPFARLPTRVRDALTPNVEYTWVVEASFRRGGPIRAVATFRLERGVENGP